MQKGKAEKSKMSFEKNWPHNTMKDTTNIQNTNKQ